MQKLILNPSFLGALAFLVEILVTSEHINLPQALETRIENEQPAIINVTNYAVSPSGDLLAITDTSNNAYIWDLNTKATVVELEAVPISEQGNLVWSPNEKYIAAAFSGGAVIWDTPTGALLHELEGHPIELISDIFLDSGYEIEKADVLAFSPDSNMLATGNFFDATVILWDIESGEIKDLLNAGGTEQGTRYIEFSSHILAIGTGAKVDLWDVESSQFIRSLAVDHEAMALSPNGDKLAVGFGRFYSYVKVFDSNTGNELQMFEAPLSVESLLWTHNGQTIFGNFTDYKLVQEGVKYVGQSITAWNVSTDELLHTFAPVQLERLGVNIASSETIIGIANDEKTVLVWDRNTGEVTNVHASENISHEYYLSLENASDFSVSGESLHLAILYTENIVIWDYETNEQVEEIQHPDKQLNKIDWVSNKSLVTLSQDHELFILDIN